MLAWYSRNFKGGNVYIIVKSCNRSFKGLFYYYCALVFFCLLGGNVDFNSAAQNAIISAGTNSSTVNISVTNDNIVEGDEFFTMNLNVPVSPGIIAGVVTMATATIIDTSS